MSDVAERVKKIVVEHLGVDADKVVESANFIDDLGADSLDTVELVMAFEEEFGVEIPDDQAETITTVGDAVSSWRRRPPRRSEAASACATGLLEALSREGRRYVRPSAHGRLKRARRLASRRFTPRLRGRQMKRVVVTGLGMVSPLACGVEATWKRLIAGEAAAAQGRDLRRLRPALQDRRAGAARIGAGRLPSRRMDGAEGAAPERRLHRLRDGGGDAGAAPTRTGRPRPTRSRCETGVLIGSGIGGLQGIAETAMTLHEKGPRRVSPFFIPGSLINLAGGQVSIRHGLKGPNHSVVTACSTGAHAIGDAARLIALGDADVMVAGGAESSVNRLALAGFSACKALSTGFNDRPKQASRPYDRDRDGFVMGEGAGCVVLEIARARQGARRADLRRDHRLRPVGRRLSHHRALAGRRRRLSRDGGGAEARRALAARHRLRQRAWHFDADRRRDRTARGRAAARQRRRRSLDVVDQILDRPSARRGGRGRGDLLDPGDSRRRRAADAESRQSLASRRRSTCVPHVAKTRRSTSRCRTRSASAAPTPR